MRLNILCNTTRLAGLALCGTLLTACASSPRNDAVVTSSSGYAYQGYGEDSLYGDRYGPYPASYYSADRRDAGDFIGYQGSRQAHRLYSAAVAETLDGQCERMVRIGYGDTLSDVAEYCDTTVAALLAANPAIRNPHQLFEGQRLRVPQVRGEVYEGVRVAAVPERPRRALPADFHDDTLTYVVRSGDTLSGIASRYGVTVGSIKALNPATDPYGLQAGATLALPASASMLTERRSIEPLPAGVAGTSSGSGPVVINIGHSAPAPRDPSAVVNIELDGASQPAASATSVNRVVTAPVIERTVSVPASQRTTGAPAVRYEVVGSSSAPAQRVVVPASATHVSASPEAGQSQLRYQASLPRDGRVYDDLGTACMRVGPGGQQQIYRLPASADGPNCGADKAVRLYRPAS